MFAFDPLELSRDVEAAKARLAARLQAMEADLRKLPP
jgi:hypothetical protein